MEAGGIHVAAEEGEGNVVQEGLGEGVDAWTYAYACARHEQIGALGAESLKGFVVHARKE